MPFLEGQGVKLAVLQEKISIYEQISKEMLSKLETAVQKISEVNQNVSKVLVRHEERLDRFQEVDNTFLKLLAEVKEDHSKAKEVNEVVLKDLKESIEEVNNKVDELSKYRWVIAGAIAILVWTVSELDLLGNIFDPQKHEPPQISSPAPESNRRGTSVRANQ